MRYVHNKITIIRFVKRIKIIRGDLYQDDFAAFLGVHRNTVKNWERGLKFPSGEVLIRLYEIFNVNLNWLLLGTGKPFLNDQDQKWQAIMVKKKDSVKEINRDRKTGKFISDKEPERRKK